MRQAAIPTRDALTIYSTNALLVSRFIRFDRRRPAGSLSA